MIIMHDKEKKIFVGNKMLLGLLQPKNASKLAPNVDESYVEGVLFFFFLLKLSHSRFSTEARSKIKIQLPIHLIGQRELRIGGDLLGISNRVRAFARIISN